MSDKTRMSGGEYLCTVPANFRDLGFDHRGEAEVAVEGPVGNWLRAYLAGRNLHARLPLLERADLALIRPCRTNPERWVVFVSRRTPVRTVESDPPASGVIFSDGCCRAGVMAIAVVSADFGIEVSRRLTQPGTVNVAECLAVIAALHTAKRRGISGAEFRTDSELVVGWAADRLQVRSRTGSRYTPVIRRLLGDVGGRLRWVPGSANRADAASRRLLCPDTPGPDTGFQELAAMKSGRDQYSRLRLSELQDRVGQERSEEARVALGGSAAVASCLRWVLRGLSLDTAIRKVLADRQIAERSKAKHASL